MVSKTSKNCLSRCLKKTGQLEQLLKKVKAIQIKSGLSKASSRTSHHFARYPAYPVRARNGGCASTWGVHGLHFHQGVYHLSNIDWLAISGVWTPLNWQLSTDRIGYDWVPRSSHRWHMIAVPCGNGKCMASIKAWEVNVPIHRQQKRKVWDTLVGNKGTCLQYIYYYIFILFIMYNM